jgi:acetoin utilization deacetylase AcuC-like enzyme
MTHDTGDHVENRERLHGILELLKAKGYDRKAGMLAPRAASLEELARVHQPSYIKTIESTAREGGAWLDADTYISQGSYQAAVYAAGGVLTALETVLAGEADTAFALVRPPGHHAMPDRAMGFCLFNNMAVGASHLLNQTGLSRVAIVDFDVHHGNGTQVMFDADRRVLYCSVHQSPLYPGTGHLEDTGAGEGRGTKVNIPLPPGSGDADYRVAFEQVVVPALQRFAPEFIMVSAGYDAHREDGLASMGLSVSGYAWMTDALNRTARECCGGRLVLTLEGGYNLTALSYSVMATLKVLLGEAGVDDPYPRNRDDVFHATAGEIIHRAASLHGLE